MSRIDNIVKLTEFGMRVAELEVENKVLKDQVAHLKEVLKVFTDAMKAKKHRVFLKE